MSLSAFFSFTFIFLNSLLFRFFLAKFFTSLFFFIQRHFYLYLPLSQTDLSYFSLLFLIFILVSPKLSPFKISSSFPGISSSLSFPIKSYEISASFLFSFSSSISLSYISFFHVSSTPFLIIFFIISYLSLLFLLSSLTLSFHLYFYFSNFYFIPLL